MTQPPAPAGQTAVDPGALAAGAGDMGALIGQCEAAADGTVQTFLGMQAAVGHPGLAGSLGSANETAVQVMLAVGKLLAYVGEGLGQSAQRYSDTESANVAVMKSVHATIA